ncbi:hypothetical protein [Chryseobacterium carnipullorum]|uniref:hypothetical protein n=1 Tax=Chryseobacterium carnipullorum TaxID=1124835 RepID=UPI000E9ACD1F|nr:hypothetical protein [Chryseobacterium carnipullorum]HBV16498.1 hypothetical protein [Chryseobacterium carnipullorum]
MLVFYLKKEKEDTYIKKMLSVIFKCRDTEVRELLSDCDSLVKFENRPLDNISEFCVELIIYIHGKDKLSDINLSNNYFLGCKISEYINEDLIVHYENGDAYQWILIKENRFF